MTAAVAFGGGIGSLLLTGCAADELDSFTTPDQYDADTQLVITLAVPRGEQIPSVPTRAANDAGWEKNDTPDTSNPYQAPTTDELKINSLRLYIFPANDDTAAPTVNRPLLIPSEIPTDGSKSSVTYEIAGLEYGTEYRMYILANFGEDATNFATFRQLEDAEVDYTSDAHNLVAGNLPMVYRSNGTFKIDRPSDGSKPKPLNISAAMQYACVKLRYNVIFDASDETHKIDGKSAKDNFGDNKLVPEEAWLSNVTKKSKIRWSDSPEYYVADDNTLAHSTLTLYKYYSEFAESGDASKGEDVVIANANNELQKSDLSTAGKWLLQGTTYVPERYVNELEEQLTLHLDSKLNGSTECKHNSVIGANVGDGKKLERGSYYEFTGHIVNTGLQGMVWTCSVQDWEPITIDVDFVSTYLTLSSTETYVDSTENGEIEYSTDGRGGISFECGDDAKVEVEGVMMDLFEPAPMTTADGTNKLQIRINSNVTITDVPSEKLKSESGVACYITSGNIRKEIKVKYDITPFFTITPTSLKIQVGDGIDDSNRYFEYRTNMGGFILKPKDGVAGSEFEKSADVSSGETKYTMVSGDPNVTLSLRPGSVPSSGVIGVSYKAASTTLIYEFDIESKLEYNNRNETESLKIEVMPDKSKYRIYFRAINDYQATDNDEFLHYNNYVLPQEYSGTGNNNANWIDYWGTDYTSSTPTNDRHRLYAYTQYGQAANTQPVWLYTAPFNGVPPDNGTQYWYFRYTDSDTGYDYGEKPADMTGDTNNPGWYYYDIPVRCNGTPYLNANEQSESIKEKYSKGPLPGATLLIFYSTDGKHRVNYDDMPGIPLGDDNDNETWVLFDPSRDPLYTVYNDKPTIEDVVYTVYSDQSFTGWRCEFGSSKSSHNLHGSVGNHMKEVTSDQPGYKKYTLTFKAPKGEYDKAVGLTTSKVINNLPIPEGNISFFFGVPDGSDGNWNNPTLHIQGGSDYTVSWTGTVKVDNITYYYYQFKIDGQLNDARNNGIRVTGGSDYSHPTGGSYIKLDGSRSQEVVVERNSWSLVDAGTAVTKTESILMFGGRNWRTGYYKNGRWSQNP